MDEAHRYYRVVQSERPNLMLPKGTQPEEKLEAAAAQVQDRLKEDNNLRGELQAEIDENQRLQDQINAGFNTPQHEKPAPQTEAQKAAESAIDPLVQTVLAGTTDFRPETFARFDLQCVFNKLDYESLKQIGELHSAKCLELINSLGHDLTLEPGVVEYVQREGYSEKFGARPMQNAAMRILGDVVSQEMLKNGGLPVYGAIEYDRRANKCFLN
jgi:C-terminal, D2-small domain, of ClpB protein